MTSVVAVSMPATTVTFDGDEQIAVVTETVTEIVELGVMGPQGPAGGPSPPGGTFHYELATLAAVHTVAHNLGFIPALARCLDDAGTNRHPTIVHLDVDTLEMHFAGPTAVAAADFT